MDVECQNMARTEGAGAKLLDKPAPNATSKSGIEIGGMEDEERLAVELSQAKPATNAAADAVCNTKSNQNSGE